MVRIFDVAILERKQIPITADAIDYAHAVAVQVDGERVQRFWIIGIFT